MATVKKSAEYWGLSIDAILRDFLPRDPQKVKMLEGLILEEGCRDALVVWKEKNCIVDGNTRYDICKANNIPFAVEYKSFSKRSEAMQWALDNQYNRRNMTSVQRIEAAHMIEDEIRAEAKERQGTRTDLGNIPPNLAESKGGESRDKLAAMAGVSHGTYEKATKVLDTAPEPIKQAMRRNDISVEAAYQATKLPEEAKQEVTRRIEGGEKPKEVVREVINRGKEDNEVEAATVPAVEEKKGVSGNPNGFPKSVRNRRAEIRSIGENMRNVSTTPMFTIDDLLYDIRLNADIYFDLLKNTINDRPELLTDENKHKIEETIDNYVLEGIANVRRSIRNAV